MSEDEGTLLVFALIAILVFWCWIVIPPLAVTRLASPRSARLVFWAWPLACLGALFAVLRLLASHDVRDSAPYLLFYMVLGAAWVGFCAVWIPWFGINGRDDVAERGNGAAATALGGAFLALTLTYAGGNIGDGPGWWVVVLCAALATGTLFLLWHLLERWTHISDAVTIDRDEASGLRLAGFLVASGLVLGRAVAGDWAGYAPTLRDFAAGGWPALLLLAAAVVVEPQLRPSPRRPAQPVLTHGILPSLAWIGAALAWVVAWRPLP